MNKFFIVLIVSMFAHSSFAMENGGKIEETHGNSTPSISTQSVDSLHRQASTVQAMTELAVVCKEINSAITRVYNVDKILNGVIEENNAQNDQDAKNRSKEVTNKSKELITRMEEASKMCLRLIDLVTAKAVVSPENKQALKNLQILMAMCAYQES